MIALSRIIVNYEKKRNLKYIVIKNSQKKIIIQALMHKFSTIIYRVNFIYSNIYEVADDKYTYALLT